MKNNKLFKLAASVLMVTCLVGCGGNNGGGGGGGKTGPDDIIEKVPFSFSVALESGKDHLEVGEYEGHDIQRTFYIWYKLIA